MPFKKPHPLYSVWIGMISRCQNPKIAAYKDYGGRGILVCKRWAIKGGEGFRNFLQDMGDRPNGYTLERIDVNGDYSPENCKWATRKEQQNNRRNTVKITIEGVEYIANEIAKKYGMKTDTIVARAKKVSTFAELTDRKKRVFLEGLSLGGKANGAKNKAKTHCKNGHEYTEQNTIKQKRNGVVIGRACKKCHAEKEKNRRLLSRLVSAL